MNTRTHSHNRTIHSEGNDCNAVDKGAPPSSRPLLWEDLEGMSCPLPEDKSPFQFSLQSRQTTGKENGGNVEMLVEITSLNQPSSFHWAPTPYCQSFFSFKYNKYRCKAPKS